jgi:hypothetical protein
MWANMLLTIKMLLVIFKVN